MKTKFFLSLSINYQGTNNLKKLCFENYCKRFGMIFADFNKKWRSKIWFKHV